MARQILLVVLLVGFGAFTAEAIYAHGIAGFVSSALSSLAGIQVSLDLVIALSLVLGWMYDDARERDAAFWPFAAVTLVLGSLGPLAYLLVRERARARAADPRALAHAGGA